MTTAAEPRPSLTLEEVLSRPCGCGALAWYSAQPFGRIECAESGVALRRPCGLPPAPEPCEVCHGPASPCIDGRCLACAGELSPDLPPPWAHGRASEPA